MTTSAHSMQQFFKLGDLTDSPEQPSKFIDRISGSNVDAFGRQQAAVRSEPKAQSTNVGTKPWWLEFVV